VYLGAFRTSELRECGGWDDRMLTNQDYELNMRMRSKGLVWFDASLAVEYTPRSTLGQLASQYRRFGRWKAASWLESRTMPALRQQGLLAISLLGGIGLSKIGRRRPLAAATAVCGGLVVVDALGGERADMRVRLAAAAAIGVVGASWVAGIGEQTLRHAWGDQLLGDGRGRGSDQASGQ
jgi:hypothetical protein